MECEWGRREPVQEWMTLKSIFLTEVTTLKIKWPHIYFIESSIIVFIFFMFHLHIDMIPTNGGINIDIDNTLEWVVFCTMFVATRTASNNNQQRTEIKKNNVVNVKRWRHAKITKSNAIKMYYHTHVAENLRAEYDRKTPFRMWEHFSLFLLFFVEA